MKAVILESYVMEEGDLDWSGVKALVPDTTSYVRTDYADIAPRIGDAELVFINKCRIDEAILAQCPNLKWVGIIATGVVPTAVEWLDRAGIAGLQQFYDTGYPVDADSIVLIDVDGTAAEVRRDQAIVERVLGEHATEVRIAENEKDRAALWYGRLNAPNSVVQSGKGFFIGDVTVPRDRIPEMQEAIQAIAARPETDR